MMDPHTFYVTMQTMGKRKLFFVVVVVVIVIAIVAVMLCGGKGG